VKSTLLLFSNEAGVCADWSVGDTGTAELSEHPTTTNAKVAISSNAKETVFMTLPFLDCLLVLM